MSMFTLAISCLTTSNLPWFMDLTFQVPVQFCFLQHRTLLLSPVPSTAGCCFCFGSVSFFLSGVISPLISSSILGVYRPGEFIFQCPIFLLFHTVHGVLQARILKWFVIPFSSGPHSVRPLHHDPPILGGATWHGLRLWSVNWAIREAQLLVWPQVNNREGTQCHPSEKNWIKDLLNPSDLPPIKTRTSFPLCQSLPSGSFHKPLFLSIRGQTEWKPQSQKTNQTDHMDHSLV